MKIKHLVVIGLITLLPGHAIATSGSEEKKPVLYLSADGIYGRPLNSYGFAARRDNGTGVLFGAEYRGWDKLSLGLNFSHINLQEDGVNATLGGLDVFGRFLFLGRGSVEPYLLLGAGYDVYLSDNRVKYQRDLSPLATAAMGTYVVLTPNWALDVGAGYQYNGPSSRSLNFPNMRLGFQYRFSRGGSPEAKAGEAVVPRSLSLKNLGMGRIGVDLGNGEIGKIQAKSWTLVIKDSSGRVVKTIEGVGAMPEELPIKGLMLGKGYSYNLGVKGKDGKDYNASGKLPEAKSWKMVVRDSHGNIVKTLEGEGAPPNDIEARGLALGKGYSVNLEVTGSDGQIINEEKGNKHQPEASSELAGTHRVGKGESLWSIAALDQVYGDGLLWPLLYDANKVHISDWNVVLTGLVLDVPKAGDDAARDEVRRRAYKLPWKEIGK